MKVQVKLDKLALFTSHRSEVLYPYWDIPNFKFRGYFDPAKNEEDDQTLTKYEKVVMYENMRNGNSLLICNQRKKKCYNASPLYLIFYTSYFHTISYQGVKAVEKFFEQYCSTRLRLSQIHLALDIISATEIDHYEEVIRSIKPGKKPKADLEKEYKTGIYFGSSKSSNYLHVYDKAQQMWDVYGLRIEGDVVRIELRLRIPQLNNFIQYTGDLAVCDWSFVYPKYYSFHQPTNRLKRKLKLHGIDWSRPIWELRDIMEERFGITPSNFYRDYLMDHPSFSDLVRDALSNYRWCRKYKQFQS
jgi:hypothetical protein